jgi:hypothetical protein
MTVLSIETLSGFVLFFSFASVIMNGVPHHHHPVLSFPLHSILCACKHPTVAVYALSFALCFEQFPQAQLCSQLSCRAVLSALSFISSSLSSLHLSSISCVTVIHHPRLSSFLTSLAVHLFLSFFLSFFAVSCRSSTYPALVALLGVGLLFIRVLYLIFSQPHACNLFLSYLPCLLASLLLSFLAALHSLHASPTLLYAVLHQSVLLIKSAVASASACMHMHVLLQNDPSFFQLVCLSCPLTAVPTCASQKITPQARVLHLRFLSYCAVSSEVYSFNVHSSIILSRCLSSWPSFLSISFFPLLCSLSPDPWISFVHSSFRFSVSS